ncbi:hypothetical protein TcCL_Unassigned02485 [Trypanosoma cruzi]|nr:hypothetical protein TcCL_Unassigned02485 [Trypanosoma cruzi]
MTLLFPLHPSFMFPMRNPADITLHGKNNCLVVVSSRSNPPGWKKSKNRRPSMWNEKELHRGVLFDANAPRPVAGVVCGLHKEVLGTPLCHTECPLETQQQACPFRSHSWRWRHPLPRRVLLASAKMLQCDRVCPTGAVLGWVGSALRGETPSATLDRGAHALPSAPLHPPGNRTAASTLSPKQHTSENVAAYFPREQSGSHTLRPSCRRVRRKRTHTHSSRHTQKKKKSSAPCHVLVRDGAAPQNNTAKCRSAFPQKTRATTHSHCHSLPSPHCHGVIQQQPHAASTTECRRSIQLHRNMYAVRLCACRHAKK